MPSAFIDQFAIQLARQMTNFKMRVYLPTLRSKEDLVFSLLVLSVRKKKGLFAKTAAVFARANPNLFL